MAHKKTKGAVGRGAASRKATSSRKPADISQADKPAQALTKRDAFGLPFHPLAEMFPLIEGEEFDALVASIKAHGLRQPITTSDGKIADGRNRARACQVAGIEPHFTEYQGAAEDLPAFIIDANIHRRHLTAEDRRRLIAELIKAKPELSDRQLGKMAKSDHKTIAKQRQRMESRGDVSPRQTRTDSKGRKQPASKPAKERKAKPAPQTPVSDDLKPPPLIPEKVAPTSVEAEPVEAEPIAQYQTEATVLAIQEILRDLLLRIEASERVCLFRRMRLMIDDLDLHHWSEQAAT